MAAAATAGGRKEDGILQRALPGPFVQRKQTTKQIGQSRGRSLREGGTLHPPTTYLCGLVFAAAVDGEEHRRLRGSKQWRKDQGGTPTKHKADTAPPPPAGAATC